ncbi:MAG: hypothetical protein MJE12_19145 [Alphaproteobacteria bacterium]|nr:hypothetical protein [Alphaproteobacteria bacterium]
MFEQRKERIDPYLEPTWDLDVCRDVLKNRTRYYLALREAGVPPLGVFILDVIVLGCIEGYTMDIETLADLLNLPPPTVRLQVVTLIKDGWIEPVQTPQRATLNMSEKGRQHAYSCVASAYHR